MSPIVARSVASFYACKPNLKNWNIFEAFLYTFLGGRPTTETICIILVCFDGKYTWVYNKMLKIEKVCLRTYYIADHLKRPRGLGSLVAGEGLVLVIRLPAIHVFRQHESHLVNWSHESHLVNWSHESHSHVSRISSRELVSRIAFPCLTNLIPRTGLTNRIPMSHESHLANWSHESHYHVSRISFRELDVSVAGSCAVRARNPSRRSTSSVRTSSRATVTSRCARSTTSSVVCVRRTSDRQAPWLVSWKLQFVANFRVFMSFNFMLCMNSLSSLL